MQFLLNELSLHNQFESHHDFLPSLKNILRIRQTIADKGYGLFCAGDILTRSVCKGDQFNQILMQHQHRTIRSVVLRWLSKEGPFWDRPSQHNFGQDYFSLDEDADVLVTKSALAEAAFWIAHDNACSTISFSPSDYCLSPLQIAWHQDTGIVRFDLSNFWELQSVESFLGSLPSPIVSWTDLLQIAKQRFEYLSFSDRLIEHLDGVPYQQAIAERSFDLLKILNDLQQCFDSNGERTSEGHRIIRDHFQGDRARFSDESDTNKIRFESDLTFALSDGTKVFCPFHGKVSTGVFRIHFTWPMRFDTPTWIVYIGPKITKD